jgi:SAM-dependent methyltransferase
MDLDREELRRARYMFYADHNEGKLRGFAEFLRGDAHYLPFRDSAFNKLIATEVLEHVFDDERVMRELRRVLRPGAEFAISCPHHRVERWLWAMSWDYWHSPGGHVRIYGKGELVERLRRHGFETRDSQGRHSYQSLYWLLRCLLGKDAPDRLPTRAFQRFIDWHLRSRNPLSEGLESLLDRVIPKDYVIYGKLPGPA